MRGVKGKVGFHMDSTRKLGLPRTSQDFLCSLTIQGGYLGGDPPGRLQDGDEAFAHVATYVVSVLSQSFIIVFSALL